SKNGNWLSGGIGSWNGCAQEALPLKGGAKTPISAQGKPPMDWNSLLPVPAPHHDAVIGGRQAVRKPNSRTPSLVSAPRYEPIDARLHNACRHRIGPIRRYNISCQTARRRRVRVD